MKKSIIVAFFFLSGCTGQIYTIDNPTPDSKGRIKGIPFYGYKTISKPITLDRIIHDKTGNITNSAYAQPGSREYCQPVKASVNEVVADYSKPKTIYLSWSLFEIRKFGVTLDKGMLASVNSESTPGPRVATEMLQDIVGVREILKGGGQKSLDGTPSIAPPPSLYLTCTHYK